MSSPGISFAVVCSSNINRSMAAHKALAEKGYRVESFGVGSQVKLPGPSLMQPNVFPFGTPYQDMLGKLKSQDEELYTKNQMLRLLQRNADVKRVPQRWQDETNIRYDVVLTFEDRIFDALCEDLHNRESAGSGTHTLHAINLHVRDTPDEADKSAECCVFFADSLAERGEDWESSVDEVIASFEEKYGRQLLHSVFFV